MPEFSRGQEHAHQAERGRQEEEEEETKKGGGTKEGQKQEKSVVGFFKAKGSHRRS